MKIVKKSGFTIIETVLFLGVTGLLIFGILAGTGNSISSQRYRDSVSSLYTMLQKQYSNVLTVDNDRNSNWKCNDDGSITKSEDVGDVRGQSECILLGKYITAEPTSNATTKMLIQNVVGMHNNSSLIPTNDMDAFLQYDMSIPDELWQEEYRIDWGSSLEDETGNPKTFSMLILQSPLSGAIRTFINPDNLVEDELVKSLISAEYLNNELKLCVNYSGLSYGNRLGLKINPQASGASAVERLGDDSGCQR